MDSTLRRNCFYSKVFLSFKIKFEENTIMRISSWNWLNEINHLQSRICELVKIYLNNSFIFNNEIFQLLIRITEIFNERVSLPRQVTTRRRLFWKMWKAVGGKFQLIALHWNFHVNLSAEIYPFQSKPSVRSFGKNCSSFCQHRQQAQRQTNRKQPRGIVN